MMNESRPNLDELDPTVRAYVEALEAEIERLRPKPGEPSQPPVNAIQLPSEPPTTLNVVTISASGAIKRTPRHLYSRQRRGGMGVFDLDSAEDDPPVLLTVVDENSSLVLMTNQARAFRLALNELPESPVRARGQALRELLELKPDERPALALPGDGGLYVALLNRQGHVRWLAGYLLGEKLCPGTTLYDAAKFSPPVSACWAGNSDDLFIASRQGSAIRFAARQASVQGCQGIRLQPGDEAVAITAVSAGSGVFLLGADGRGSIRLMSGFRANKAPGAGGKIAIKTDRLVGAAAVAGTAEADDIFIISRLGKIIRFPADEAPAKEGAVQGVNCMALRADETVALTISA